MRYPILFHKILSLPSPMSLLLPLFASYSTGVSLTHNLPSILLQHSFCFFNPLEHSPPRKSHLDEICSLNFFSSDLPTFHLLLGGPPQSPQHLSETLWQSSTCPSNSFPRIQQTLLPAVLQKRILNSFPLFLKMSWSIVFDVPCALESCPT